MSEHKTASGTGELDLLQNLHAMQAEDKNFSSEMEDLKNTTWTPSQKMNGEEFHDVMQKMLQTQPQEIDPSATDSSVPQPELQPPNTNHPDFKTSNGLSSGGKRELLARKLKERYNVKSNESSLERLEALLSATQESQRCKYNIKILKQMLIFLARALEKTASFADPKRQMVNLDGYAEHLQLSISEFEEILYDVHDVYLSKFSADPLATLVIAFGSSAAIYSMTRKMIHAASFGVANSDNEIGRHADRNENRRFAEKDRDDISEMSELDIRPEDIMTVKQ